MEEPKSSLGSHPSLPLTLSALTSCSLRPDYDYLVPTNARKLNSLLQTAGQDWTAGEIVAAGLLGRAYLAVLHFYLRSAPQVLFRLDHHLTQALGEKSANQDLVQVLTSFPPPLVFSREAGIDQYLLNGSDPERFRHRFYNSLILILASDRNPFFRQHDGLFTDPALRQYQGFQDLNDTVSKFFQSGPPLPGSGKSLFDFLLEPARSHPDSIFDQLVFIRMNWADLLEPELLNNLLTGLDLIREETHADFVKSGPPLDPLGFGPASYLDHSDQVRFSADQDWMPRVILLAKNIFVWLDQLSQQYQRPIHRLDQIPEQVLSRLQDWGITALWLIGIWERSSASQQIKQITGNPDAVPSAYSLDDYAIADTLGGEAGYQALRELAFRHGIRLAADMVPNHMGIDSRWVREHPDWFLSLDQAPFPGYSYSGPDLTLDPSFNIYLEDHYYDKTDAAVVFKFVDLPADQTRFIYHGNDGTSMPWNDTAQLNFLNPDVREAVIQTILHVARKFPIIRFDAAMTLTKKHYQRLWFPEPGTGGAIPTRADFGLSKRQFDLQMPEEFWREVVDRVAEEVPDTLLLAEAFWMMEGYFVRSLGMHRVYNSAFMHMLRDEHNAQYRELILKTLDYDPQILKRYVNFMNNPDEETAAAQFGSGGKYFGTCVLMATLPGLPMFGHGQIEGYTEKYGMEYKRAYYDESPDKELIERHKQEVFPLLHKRYLFAEVDHFFLYDFQDQQGNINQDVFAYSNRSGDEKSLVLFHNKWAETQGSITHTAALRGPSQALLAGLGISPDSGEFLLFRDHISGLEYIRSLASLAEGGLEIYLGAYQYRVFLDFRAVADQDGSYRLLEEHLAGEGAHSLEKTRRSLICAPLVKQVRDLLQATHSPSADQLTAVPADKLIPRFVSFIASNNLYPSEIDPESVSIRIRNRLAFLENHLDLIRREVPLFQPFYALLGCFLADLSVTSRGFQLSDLFDDYLEISGDNSFPGYRSDIMIAALAEITQFRSSFPDIWALTDFWFSDERTRKALRINLHQGILWFNKESMESLAAASISVLAGLHAPGDFNKEITTAENDLIPSLGLYSDKLQTAIDNSDFQVGRMKEIIGQADSYTDASK